MTKGSTNRTLDPATKWYRNEGRGPNGRRLCRWCGVEVPKGRRTFCSDECVHEWRLRSDPGYLRDQVFLRDKGVCAICGMDTEALRVAVEKARRDEHWYPPGTRDERIMGRLTEMGISVPGPISGHRVSLWDADHIIPVVEGGGECDLSNMRTLCVWCHRDVTAELRRRLAGHPEQLRLFDGEA